MNQRVKQIISLVAMIILTLLLLRSLYLNLATFDKLNPPLSQTNDNLSLPFRDEGPASRGKKMLEFPCDQVTRADWLNQWWYFAGHFEDKQNPAHLFGLTLIFHKNPPRIKFNLSDSGEEENFSGTINFDRYDIFGEDKINLKKDDIFWTHTGDFKFKIGFAFADRQISFDLISLKNPIVIANNEQKFYCQYPRLEAAGTLVIKNKHYEIKGQGWIDHQGFKNDIPWKSWRWHSLQLNNDNEIAFVSNFMNKSGEFLKKGNLSIINDQGILEVIDANDYQIEYLENFHDPQTNIKYPIKWRLEIPQRHIKLVGSSITADQVIDGTNGFYEGSCQVSGIFAGQPMSGRAQFEYSP